MEPSSSIGREIKPVEITKSPAPPMASIRYRPGTLAVTIGVRLLLAMISVVFDLWVACTPHNDRVRPTYPEIVVEGSGRG